MKKLFYLIMACIFTCCHNNENKHTSDFYIYKTAEYWLKYHIGTKESDEYNEMYLDSILILADEGIAKINNDTTRTLLILKKLMVYDITHQYDRAATSVDSADLSIFAPFYKKIIKNRFLAFNAIESNDSVSFRKYLNENIHILRDVISDNELEIRNMLTSGDITNGSATLLTQYAIYSTLLGNNNEIDSLLIYIRNKYPNSLDFIELVESSRQPDELYHFLGI